MCTKVLEIKSTSKSARLVTIVVLIILAGITLNAVIGENGIILQAKDTKNLITNETTYDNQQLAQLQNELKDNGLYSGIGIIPGTDTGGGSEGGENGTHTNQWTNTEENNNNSQGTTNISGNTNKVQNGEIINSIENEEPGDISIGKTNEDPRIQVISGEKVATSFYRSDVTIQIFTLERTKRIKYILSTTVDSINNELYPSGLVRELDIENGGTLTFTKDGEYTITAYAYDSVGNKSNPTVMWLKRTTSSETKSGVEVSISGGNIGSNSWYNSNITLRVLGTDQGTTEVKYRVQGIAYGTGYIGNLGWTNIDGPTQIDTGEQNIANGTTFRIAMDGEYTITAYTYNNAGMRLSTSEALNLKRDATRPIITSIRGEQLVGNGFKVDVSANDGASKLTSNAYTYRYKLASTLEDYTSEVSSVSSKTYVGLNQMKTYDMYVVVTDQAGNMSATDVISKPALWISNTPTAGETMKNGKEGYTKYYRSDITVKLRGQDANNVDISKTTYQILGTVTDNEKDGTSGKMDGSIVAVGTELKDEKLISDKETKTIQLQANGNWKIKVHTYDKEGKLVTTNTLEITRDTIPPIVQNFAISNLNDFDKIGNTTNVEVEASDATGGLSTLNDTYSYYLNNVYKSTTANTSYNFTLDTSGTHTFKVIAKDKAGNISDEKTTQATIYYLVDKVNIGDYVAYNCGTWPSGTRTGTRWTAAPDVPDGTTSRAYGGYVVGENKGTSRPSRNTSYQTSTSGWRVLSKSGSGINGTVLLVSAGTPCQVYIGGGSSSNFESLNNFCNDNFVQSTYANNARPVSRIDSYNEETILSNAGLLINGSRYLFSRRTSSTGTDGAVNYTYAFYWINQDDGTKTSISSASRYGVRPVVTLKSGVKTDASKNQQFLNQNCWQVK